MAQAVSYSMLKGFLRPARLEYDSACAFFVFYLKTSGYERIIYDYRRSMDWHLIAGPIVGALIGAVTNGIALRMLFRPLYPIYLGKWKLPFTPGLIPKERGRLASAVGEAISSNLMNHEVLENTLLSEEMLQKLSAAIDGYFRRQSENQVAVREYLYGVFSEDDTENAVGSVREEVAGVIHKYLSNPEIGEKVSKMIMVHVMDKVKDGLFGAIGADRFVKMLADPAERLLAKHINETLSSGSEQMIWDIVETESERFLDMRMCDVFDGREQIKEDIKAGLISSYRKLVSSQMPRILAAVDIKTMVEKRINEMDIRELEQMVIGIMKKELGAIVWLGGLLGFLMGFLNI